MNIIIKVHFTKLMRLAHLTYTLSQKLAFSDRRLAIHGMNNCRHDSRHDMAPSPNVNFSISLFLYCFLPFAVPYTQRALLLNMEAPSTLNK